MARNNYGYTGTRTVLQQDNKFYTVYLFHNAETGDSRALFNWGRHGTNGQWKTESSIYVAKEKIRQKRKAGYFLVGSLGEEIPVNLDLLMEAGLTLQQLTQEPAPTPTPVEVSHLDKFVTELNRVAAELGEGVTPQVLIAFTNLRQQLEDLKVEMHEAEGRMEMLSAMITHKFEGIQA